ncbi:MAG: hypothetical protein M0Z55_05820 [Peptococcaceae bacterium]|nr:hypothetical protein [Peptococcaceae bacterium]
MDNEKFQDLMMDQFAKMFKEFQDVKDSQVRMESRLGNVESELSGVKQSQVRMETEFGKKLDVLYYDWRDTQKQFNEEVKAELTNLGTKVEALQMESSKHEQEIKDLYLVKASKE